MTYKGWYAIKPNQTKPNKILEFKKIEIKVSIILNYSSHTFWSA